MTARRATVSIGVVLLAALAAGCGGSASPTTPLQPPLPVSAESASFRYHYASADGVDSTWQEAYHAWATTRLGIQMPQKIEYYKYASHQAMGEHTGNYTSNAFAEPSRFEIHTLFRADNHEVVHIYMSLVGRPSDFFDEGIAVAFQTHPPAGDFASLDNGQEIHHACRQYQQSGTLLPLDQMITTTAFRSVSDNVLSYRESGSFVRFAIDRIGLPQVLDFFRASGRSDDVATIKSRFLAATGTSIDDAEREWLAMLRAL